MKAICGLLLAVVIGGGLVHAQSRMDDSGRLERLALGQGWVPLKTDVRLPLKGWGKQFDLSAAADAKTTTEGDVRTWRATLGAGQGPAVQIEQTVRHEEGRTILDLKATGLRDGDIEGVLLFVNFPADKFAGGTLKAAEQSIALPATLPPQIHLYHGAASPLLMADASETTRIRLETTPAAQVSVQDGRKWAQEFTAMVYIHRGNLAQGQTAQMRIALSASGQIDQAPASFTLDASKVRYRLSGIGGNYCFSIESPVTRYTLENLKVAAARTEMSLRLWAPNKLDADPSSNDWTSFAVADQPNSRLRRELELMRHFSAQRIPYTSSIWRMPLWMVTPTGQTGDARPRVKIMPEQWPQVLQAIGSYLLYAKEKYQAEPDYFSFNESNLGVDVLQTPEEHRDAIKRLGAHFAKLGLKTRLLLGDVAGPRGTHVFCLPTANDPEAMKYVGAISFHSWHGASPTQYAAWGDLAEKLQVPLIVGEAGVDAGAWRKGAYRSFSYAVREMAHYQELLLHARPQSILYWEYTGDYSLMASDRAVRGQPILTERFCMHKHYCDLTPAGSQALDIRGDNPAILATAFRSDTAYTIHLANPQWQRPLTLRGLPAGIKTLNVVRTAQGDLFKALEPLAVIDGTVRLTLPTESFTTLTTLPIPPVKPMQ